ncbi:endochitinase 33 [Parachaetomium inaequale]|uniref:chitinase n=1 Tax=Parachaetomium inaequale TaxID=2588326 RepID=A0AAN6PQ30_9PEZI|nr:endochitinase 33 [Parachaetomium inaequale]
MRGRARLAALCGLIATIPGVLAGFDPVASNNIAIYWGQNSINRAQGGQQRLATYCSNTSVNIIPLAFLTTIKNPTSVNFANAGDNCTTFSGTQLLRCPEIEQDILACQALNKSILLSLGGATYTEGGFASPSEATTWAATLWSMFGPPPPPPSNTTTTTTTTTTTNNSTTNSTATAAAPLRPFGAASVDGFDMDFEAPSANMAAFVSALRGHMDAAAATQTSGGEKTRKFLLSAAPQCPFPDAAMREMLEGVGFDFVSVQFYNNYCGAPGFVSGPGGPGNFNFGTWDEWARNGSVNKGVKVLVGLPGSTTAAGSGYVSGEQLKAVVQYARGFESFGGVMVWDMSQVYGNPGFLDSVVSALGGQLPGTTSTSTTASSTPSSTMMPTRTPTTTTSGTPPTGTLVPHWGQCGGREFLGSTQCEPPYTCVFVGDWWSHCA